MEKIKITKLLNNAPKTEEEEKTEVKNKKRIEKVKQKMMTTLKMSGFSDEEALNLIEENWKYSQHLTLTRDKLRFIYANI